MKHLGSLIVACLGSAFLAACGGSTGLAPSTTAFGRLTAVPQFTEGSAALFARMNRNLYVVNGSNVAVYAAGSNKRLQKISQGMGLPHALAFDPSGKLYVSNWQGHNVTVYAPGSKSVFRKIYHGVINPSTLAFDAAGNLYVANYFPLGSRPRGDVTVYAPGGDKPLRTISQGIKGPFALAFDSSGNLYIANGSGHSVTVYAPGSNSVLREIYHGVIAPVAMALDPSGSLYVANCRRCTGYGGGGAVMVYAPGSKEVLRTISQGVDQPYALAFDPAGNVYVANYGCRMAGRSSYCYPLAPSTVTVYAPGSKEVLRTISQGVNEPEALAFDSTGNLYVANDPYPGFGTVKIYAPGKTKVLETISHSDGVWHPNALAFGPR